MSTRGVCVKKLSICAVDNKKRVESLSTTRKAESARLSATSIRRAGWKVVLYLLDGLAYDLEPMALGARQ
ncbi:hypothetical protein [Bacillus sp. FJAT-29937]|uniref:hypothetical protein n=1 Tax=Bacillus sp. FJAT-29937 TaxID=1720553 RepID=UPI0012E3E2CC|nr:hypothetical protein [Bacillus sp. FJAT-29937]